MFSVTTKGRLLVATPPLEDPNFNRTVIYVIEHRNEGAVGVVINRSSEESLNDLAGGWVDLQRSPSTVFFGGPVEPTAMVALGRPVGDVADDHDILMPIAADLVGVDMTADPAIAAADVSEVRVFRGYAGWGRGQLDAEIGAGTWLSLAGSADDVFNTRPEELWRAVLARQGGRLAWLAAAPDDLSLN